jgi:AraC-like DNA-binding protein
MLVRPNPGRVVWPAAMIVWGPGFTSAGHRHHSVQLIMALRGDLLIRGASRGEWMKCGAALVRPDAAHEVDARNTTILIGFIDSESELGKALEERIDGDISCIPEKEVACWRASLGRTLTEPGVERWVRTQLLHRRRAVRIHPRVNRVLKYLREKLGASYDFSLKTLSDISGLSQSRFMHVFTESVGVPLRPYILWLRLQRASCDLMAGASATSAAHDAGFSDAAHLTRTFRRMLGVTPTDLALRKRMSRGVSLGRGESLSRADQSQSPHPGSLSRAKSARA